MSLKRKSSHSRRSPVAGGKHQHSRSSITGNAWGANGRVHAYDEVVLSCQSFESCAMVQYGLGTAYRHILSPPSLTSVKWIKGTRLPAMPRQLVLQSRKLSNALRQVTLSAMYYRVNRSAHFSSAHAEDTS